MTHAFRRCCFRVEAWNKGKSNAVDVELFAKRLLVRQEDGSSSDVPGFVPTNLLWAPTGKVVQTIIPEIPKYCSLGHVDVAYQNVEDKVAASLSTPKLDFCFDFSMRQDASPVQVKPGVYELELVLGGSNARATGWRVEVRFDGSWSDDDSEMSGRAVRIATRKLKTPGSTS